MPDNRDSVFRGVRCKYCGSTIVLTTTGTLPDEISLPCDDCGRLGVYARTKAIVVLPAEARKHRTKIDRLRPAKFSLMRARLAAAMQWAFRLINLRYKQPPLTRSIRYEKWIKEETRLDIRTGP